MIELPRPEANQWAYAIDQAIKGERLTYVYDTWREAKHDFELVRQIMGEIGLWHEAKAWTGYCLLSVGDGGIRFLPTSNRVASWFR